MARNGSKWLGIALIRSDLILSLKEKLFIAIYILFYNGNSEKCQESRENRGPILIIPSKLDIFRSQNTKDAKNDIKLQ